MSVIQSTVKKNNRIVDILQEAEAWMSELDGPFDLEDGYDLQLYLVKTLDG